MWAAETLHMT